MSHRSSVIPAGNSNGTTHAHPAPSPARKARATLAEALALYELGWSLMPLCHPNHEGAHPPTHAKTCTRPGKHPTMKWKPLQTQRLTPEELRPIWERNPGLNLAVITGLVSGIVMVDIDTFTGEQEWMAVCGGKGPRTWEFGTGRGGRHLVFKWENKEAPAGNPFKGLKGHLDFLGEGHQSVIPPSVHVDGPRYAWKVGGPRSAVPIAAAPAELVARLTGGKAGADREPAGAVAPASVGGDDYDRRLNRAIAWTKGFEPAVAGHGGHATAFKLADSLVNGFGLSDADAAAVMSGEWNERCNPPWAMAELLHKVADARQNGIWTKIEEKPLAKPAPYCPPRPAPAPPAAPPPAPPPAPPAEVLPGRLASAVSEAQTRWLFEPYVPFGQISLVVGQPATGKSTFLAYLMAKGARVVMLPGHEEDPALQLRPRLRAHGVNPDNVLLLEEGHWQMPHAQRRLTDVVRQFGAQVVIIDPIDSYTPEGFSENDGTAVRYFLEAWNVVGKETGAAVVGVRHPGKTAGNVLVGSRSWRAVPRQIVHLQHDAAKGKQRIISTFKYSLLTSPVSHYFTLCGATDGAPAFRLGGAVSEATAELVSAVTDVFERRKIDEARELIMQVLAEGEMEAAAVYGFGERLKIGETTMRRARDLVGVVIDQRGKGPGSKSFWRLPAAGG